MRHKIAKALSTIITLAIPMMTTAQTTPNILGSNDQANIISTAVPFLLITPDSRAGALGDAGVATSPDVYSQHWNAAKYLFAEHNAGISISYTPWLKKFVDDMSISYLSGYFKNKRNSAFGYSMTYFNYGEMAFTDYNGSKLKTFKPKEFCADISYSMKLSQNMGASITMRYINSNLTGGLTIGQSEETHVGHAVSGDIAVFYQNIFEGEKLSGALRLGAQISNIGSKISYTKGNENFIPTNMKIGASYQLDLDQYNSLMITADINKLLVPTPPIYNTTRDSIIAGKDPDVSVITGIFQSFGDAPGGMSEELKELYYSLGLEYCYNKTLAARMGYFCENKDKGGRKYLTFGFGLTFKALQFDFAYLVATTESNPLQNTVRFSLGINLDKLKK